MMNRVRDPEYSRELPQRVRCLRHVARYCVTGAQIVQYSRAHSRVALRAYGSTALYVLRTTRPDCVRSLDGVDLKVRTGARVTEVEICPRSSRIATTHMFASSAETRPSLLWPALTKNACFRALIRTLPPQLVIRLLNQSRSDAKLTSKRTVRHPMRTNISSGRSEFHPSLTTACSPA